MRHDPHSVFPDLNSSVKWALAAEEQYTRLVRDDTRAIHSHLPTLRAISTLFRDMAREDPRVVRIAEFGTGRAASTLAFLLGNPLAQINSFDLELIKSRSRDLTAPFTGVRFFTGPEGDVRKLPETPGFKLGATNGPHILFIDDDHSYEQVKWELETFPTLVSHCLILHDTHSNRWPGVSKAVEEWRPTPEGQKWSVLIDIPTDHGLTAFIRKDNFRE